jgi:replicative DNA helicase
MNHNPPDLQNGKRHRMTQRDGVRVDRTPPHALQSEQALLGCLLLDANVAMPLCAEIVVEAEAFFDLRHQALFELLRAMHDASEIVDMVTVTQRLLDKGRSEAVGGASYLLELQGAAATPYNAGEYAKTVAQKFTLRRIVQTCAAAVGRVFEGDEEPAVLLDSLERDVLAIAERDAGPGQASIGNVVNDAMETIESYSQRGGVLTGISTGFVDYDKLTGGLQQAETTVLAARPSVGKTSLALNIVEHVAVENSLPVGVFSLEMTAKSLAMRMISSMARVNLRNITDGFLADRDVPRLISAAGKLRRAPVFIDDSGSLTLMQLRTRARRMKKSNGIVLLVIDYLQLIASEAEPGDNRQQEVADVSRGIKSLAKELNVPVLVLSQLNRTLDRERRRPKLADLRESGAIEQDADNVVFLYRPAKKDDADEDETVSDAHRVELIVGKQRNGPTEPTIELTFLRSYTRFENAARVSDDDVPTQTNWVDKL